MISNKNLWIDNIKRLRIYRKTNKKNLRLDFAERTSDFDNKFFKKFIKSLTQEDFITYPSYELYDDLRKKISKINKVLISNIAIDSGSDACIKNIIQITSNSNSEVLSNIPSFPMYKIYCDTLNIKFKSLRYDKHLNLPISNIIKKITKKTTLIILANPNSPYGDFKNIEEIKFFLKHLKKLNIYLLVDEAYVDFSPNSVIKLLKNYKNLIITRTFSKGWGAAGCRVGYVISDNHIIKRFQNVQLTYPISNISIKFALYLIENYKLVKKYCKDTIKSRNIIVKLLKSSNFDVIDSKTNSIHFHHKYSDNQHIIQILNKSGVAFKAGGKLTGTPVNIEGDNRDTWIRLSLGPETHSQNFIKKILIHGKKNLK